MIIKTQKSYFGRALLCLGLCAASFHITSWQFPSSPKWSRGTVAAIESQQEDLLAKIRNRLTWEVDLEHPLIKKHIQAYKNSPATLEKLLQNAEPFLYFIVTELERRSLPLELAFLPMIESEYRPHAKSPVGASGLWQIMPGTARLLHIPRSSGFDGRKDIPESTKAALDYLEYFYATFEGDWNLALAAYNAGEGNVRRAIKRNIRSKKDLDYFSLPLPRETMHYVPKLLALIAIIKNPENFDIALLTIPNKPIVVQVKVDAHTPIALAAQMADINMEQLFRLNPGFQKGALPSKAYSLLLPLQNAVLYRHHRPVHSQT